MSICELFCGGRASTKDLSEAEGSEVLNPMPRSKATAISTIELSEAAIA
jgi:hypothetical protein